MEQIRMGTFILATFDVETQAINLEITTANFNEIGSENVKEVFVQRDNQIKSTLVIQGIPQSLEKRVRTYVKELAAKEFPNAKYVLKGSKLSDGKVQFFYYISGTLLVIDET